MRTAWYLTADALPIRTELIERGRQSYDTSVARNGVPGNPTERERYAEAYADMAILFDPRGCAVLGAGEPERKVA